jgi:hypothetical protein
MVQVGSISQCVQIDLEVRTQKNPLINCDSRQVLLSTHINELSSWRLCTSSDRHITEAESRFHEIHVTELLSYSGIVLDPGGISLRDREERQSENPHSYLKQPSPAIRSAWRMVLVGLFWKRGRRRRGGFGEKSGGSVGNAKGGKDSWFGKR